MKKCLITGALFLALTLLVACGPGPRSRTAAVLDDVESYINERPDSALAVLRQLDSADAPHGAAQRARLALLLTSALDKCYDDITTPGLMDQAIMWYDKHGTADEKMKAYYYQGRILQDKGNQRAAAIAYSQAERFADNATDEHAKGLLYLAFGSVYNTVYNYQQELRLKQKGLSILEAAGDPLYDAACGELALVYHSMKEWDRADSLYRKAIANATNSYAKGVFLSNYSRMMLLQPQKDPAGAIELLDKKRIENKTSLTIQEAGAYAYALVLLGKKDEAEKMIFSLESISGPLRGHAIPWLYRISEAKGEYAKALSLSKEMWAEESDVIKTALSEEISETLQQYYDALATQERTRKELIGRTAIICILALVIAILLLLIKKGKVEAERTRLIEIRSKLQVEMDALEERLTDISSELEISEANLRGEQERNVAQSKLLEDRKEELDAVSRKMEQLQKDYDHERFMRYRQLGRLGSTIWQREKKRMDESTAWQELKEELTYIHQLQNGGVELIRRMDKELGGTISRLRQDLGLRGRPREVLFLCCCILDIDPVVISDVLEISVDNVYKKRSRYRHKLEMLGNDEYLQLFRR